MERQKYIPPFKENPSRRIFPSRLMLKIFPTEIMEDASSFQEINEHMHNGYGVVITYNHISLSDHIRIIATCITNVKSIATRAIVSPIAEHQYNTPIINFCRETHVVLLPIITPHTIKKYREQGKSTTDKNICREKYKKFILNAHDALNRGGSVFIAPQGGRKPSLGNPLTYGPLYHLLENYPNEKLLFVSAGLGIPDISDYATQKTRGLNVLRRYTLKVSSPFTRKELVNKIQGDENKIDAYIFNALHTVVPDAYK